MLTNRKLNKFRSLPITLFLIVFSLPFSYNCFKTPLDPVVPEWQTQLNLTILNKTFYFSDMVNKDSKFDTAGYSTNKYVLYRPTENAIGSRQGIPPDVFNMPSPKGNTIDQKIGSIPIKVDAPPTFQLTAKDLGINSANLNPSFPPQTAKINPFPGSGVVPVEFPTLPLSQILGDTSNYVYIIFQSGFINLKITNNFNFDVQFIGDSLQLINYNKASDSTEIVASFKFPLGKIASKTIGNATAVNLSNVKMDGILKLKGAIKTIGAQGKLLSPTDNIILEVSMLNPKIKSMFHDPAPPIVLNQGFGNETNFKYIVYDNGVMKLSITNNFPFTMQFVGDSVQLVNDNSTDSSVVGTFKFNGPIFSTQTLTSDTVSLSTKKMYALLRLKGIVVMTDYFGKTVASSDNIFASLQISKASLKSALANTISFGSTDIVTVPDSAIKLDEQIKVKLAKFRSGAMKIRIINNAGLQLSVKFGISELTKNSNGLEYTLKGTNPTTGDVTVEPKDSLVETINMNEVSFVSRDRKAGDTVVTQFLHFKLEIKTLKSKNLYDLINSDDNIIADVQPSGSFVLDEVQGKIPPRDIPVNQSFDVGIGDIGDKFTLKGLKSDIKLAIKILSTGLFPTDVNLYVIPVNKIGGTKDSVRIVIPNNAKNRIDPGVASEILIGPLSVDTLVNSFRAPTGEVELPSKFIVRGTVTVSPDDVYKDTSTAKAGVGKVNQVDSVFVNLDYAIPVAIGIKDGLLKSPPTEFSESISDTAQLNLIKNGKIYLDVTNTFPLDVDMSVRLLKGMPLNKKLIDSSSINSPVLTIPQPRYNSVDSSSYPPLHILADTTVLRTGQRSFTFLNLTPDDARKLSDASFSAVDLKLITAGNGITPKIFNLTDKLVMTVKANIIFLINQDHLK